MSIIIKDVDIPKTCDGCFARHPTLSMCLITDRSTSHGRGNRPLDQTKRPSWCPIIGLPEVEDK